MYIVECVAFLDLIQRQLPIYKTREYNLRSQTGLDELGDICALWI